MFQIGVKKMVYRINETFQVIVPSTRLVESFCDTSNILTECLFGETVKVIKISGHYIYVKLLTDDYEGWIKSESLGNLSPPSHRVISIRTFIHNEPNVKSKLVHYLSMGSLVKIKRIYKNWAEIELSEKHNYSKGYIPLNHLVKLNNKITDWVSIAEKFIGVPYKWGGRDTIGIDCSALLQLSVQTHGIQLPRDSCLQLNHPSFQKVELKNKQRGNIIFWEGHVAILVNETNIIHSNAYTMKTNIERYSIAEERIRKRYGNVIKIVKLK